MNFVENKIKDEQEEHQCGQDQDREEHVYDHLEDTDSNVDYECDSDFSTESESDISGLSSLSDLSYLSDLSFLSELSDLTTSSGDIDDGCGSLDSILDGLDSETLFKGYLSSYDWSDIMHDVTESALTSGDSDSECSEGRQGGC